MMNQQPSPIKNTKKTEKTFVSNFAQMVRIRGDFSTEELHIALDRVRARHGLLIPHATSDDPLASHFPVRVLMECGDTDWMEVVKEELRQPFLGNNGPFARFVLLRMMDYSDLIGIFHHGICDGMSGVYVLRDVVQMLGDPTVELPPISIPPDFLRLVPKSVVENPRISLQLRTAIIMLRLSQFFRSLRKRLFPNSLKKTPAQSEFSGEGLPPSQRYCILTETLTVSQTTALVRRCKAEQTSVHAAVSTAWLRAFSKVLEGRKSWIRSVSSPVSLRDRLAHPVGDTAGIFLSMVETHVNCAPGRDFWQIAREFKQKLMRGSTDEKLFMMPLMITTLLSQFSEAELGEVIGNLFNGPVKYDFSITNLGRLDIPVQIGLLRVEVFYNMVNTSEHERTVGVNTLGDKMTFSFMFRESKMDPVKAEQLMAQAIGQLTNAVG